MVGRQAQIIPTLISTTDQMIEGVASSDHVSVNGKHRKEIRPQQVHQDCQLLT